MILGLRFRVVWIKVEGFGVYDSRCKVLGSCGLRFKVSGRMVQGLRFRSVCFTRFWGLWLEILVVGCMV